MQRLCLRLEADEIIKGCIEGQSLTVRVERRATESQVVVQLFLIVAQAAPNFSRSADPDSSSVGSHYGSGGGWSLGTGTAEHLLAEVDFWFMLLKQA